MQYYDPAGFWKRFVAFILDYLLILVIAAIYMWFIGTFIGFNDKVDSILTLTLGGFAIFYFLVKDGLFEGASVGKKIMNLRVVHFDNQSIACDFRYSIKRNLVFIITLFAIIAGLQIIFSKEKRRIGDGWANTVVIDLEYPLKDAKSTIKAIKTPKPDIKLVLASIFIVLGIAGTFISRDWEAYGLGYFIGIFIGAFIIGWGIGFIVELIINKLNPNKVSKTKEKKEAENPEDDYWKD